MSPKTNKAMPTTATDASMRASLCRKTGRARSPAPSPGGVVPRPTGRCRSSVRRTPRAAGRPGQGGWSPGRRTQGHGSPGEAGKEQPGALGEALASAPHRVAGQVEQLSGTCRRRPRTGHHLEAGPYHAPGVEPAVGDKARQHGVAHPAYVGYRSCLSAHDAYVNTKVVSPSDGQWGLPNSVDRRSISGAVPPRGCPYALPWLLWGREQA